MAGSPSSGCPCVCNNPLLPPPAVPTPANRAMRAARTNLRALVRELVEARRREPSGADDVLSRLVRAQLADRTMSDDDIIDECVGFLFAGHETTASTLTWALYELASRPGTQQLIAREGRSISRSSVTLHDDVAGLSETCSVVEETLRMYPAGISIVRVTKKGTQLAGHKARKGTLVMIAVYRIQRRPSVWESPDEFDSHRPNLTVDSELRDSFLAFGLGPRRCLGARFARTEMRLALSLICARWQLSYEAGAPPLPEVRPALRVRGTLPIRLSAG